MNQPLLAKSSVSGKPPKTLVDHTKDVIAAVGFLYGTEDRPTRLAREWLRFFRLEREDYNCFLANTLGAAAFHDPGKALVINLPGVGDFVGVVKIEIGKPEFGQVHFRGVGTK